MIYYGNPKVCVKRNRISVVKIQWNIDYISVKMKRKSIYLQRSLSGTTFTEYHPCVFCVSGLES